MKLSGDRCRCTVCGEHFNRTSVFDKHRIGHYDGGRRCLSVDEMKAKGWLHNDAGFWIMQKMALLPAWKIRQGDKTPKQPKGAGKEIAANISEVEAA